MITEEMKHLDYKRKQDRELPAPGDWMHICWDKHYDQKLTVSASPIRDCSWGEETGEKSLHPIERDQSEATFKEISWRLWGNTHIIQGCARQPEKSHCSG